MKKTDARPSSKGIKNSSRFFCNRDCCYFPCHEGIPEESFNCLFCYCPLYLLGKECGGNFEYTENGIKSCKNCILPHQAQGYDRIIARISKNLHQPLPPA